MSSRASAHLEKQQKRVLKEEGAAPLEFEVRRENGNGRRHVGPNLKMLGGDAKGNWFVRDGGFKKSQGVVNRDKISSSRRHKGVQKKERGRL